MSKQATSFVLSLTLVFCLFASAVTGIEVAKYLEHTWFPVIVDFKIEETSHMVDTGAVVISGSLTKQRDCRFVEVVGLSDEQVIEVTFLDRLGRNKSRPEGTQDFGPWRLQPDLKLITLVARHSCHTFWDTITVLYKGEIK
jgi:hypothetical protein